MSGVEEYEKMKVAELKRELKAAGLSGEGKKSELVQRLAEHRRTEQKLLGAAATDDVDDASLEALEANVLGEDLQPPTAKATSNATATSPAKKASAPATKMAPAAAATKPAPTKETPAPVTATKIRLSTTDEAKSTANGSENSTTLSNETEAKLARAKKFGLPESSALSADEKKAARAARFGTSSGDKPSGKDVTASAPPVDKDKLKNRAERFGLVVSEVTGQALNVPAGLSAEKLKARQERFGAVSEEAKAAATSEQRRKRAARFGLDEVEEKKAKRAQRFAIATA